MLQWWKTDQYTREKNCVLIFFRREKKEKKKYLIRVFAFAHSLKTEDFRQIGKKIEKSFSQQRDRLEENCVWKIAKQSSPSLLSIDFTVAIWVWNYLEMSSIYSMHRPGFWRVPKFKSKEEQGPKKKVHFYDDFVSDSKYLHILLLISWQCKVAGWQVNEFPLKWIFIHYSSLIPIVNLCWVIFIYR